MRRIGPYELRDELARGGMGVVYRAHDPRAGRDVALKVLLSGVGDDPEEVERFRREGEAAASLRHPGVVRIHDLGWDQGQPYLVMDLIEGRSLRQRIKEGGALPEAEAAQIAAALADALHHAHGQGVLHRDLKPENVILLEGGAPLLTDFGLAKLSNAGQSLTATGSMLGTPAYMPPEQALGDKALVGPRSDVYGLGATLYEMLTGAPPFAGKTSMEVLTRVLEEPPPPPSRVRPDLSPWLEEVCLRCLAKAPEDRFPSALELAQALTAPPQVARPWKATLLVAAGALVVAGGVAAAWPSAPPDPKPLPVEPTAPTATPQPARGTAPTEPRTLTELCERARERVAGLDWQGAAADLEAAAAIDPRSPRFLTARACYRIRASVDHVGALEDLRLAQELAGEDPERLLLQAVASAARGMRPEARRLAEQALALDPSRAETYVEQVNVYGMIRDAAAAREALEKARARAPGTRRLAYLEAELVSNSGDPEGALQLLAPWLERNPADVEMVMLKAVALARLGRREDVFALLDRAEAAAGPLAELRRLRGFGHKVWKELDQAEAVYRQVEELWPEHPLLPLSWAELHLARQDLEGARDWLKRGVARFPNNAHMHKLLASVLERLGETREAVLALTVAIPLRPQDSALPEARARLLIQLGSRAQATEDVNRAIIHDPDRAALHVLRGDLRHAAGNQEGALSAYGRALELEPGNPEALIGRGRIRADQRRWDDAVRNLTGAVEARDPKLSPLAKVGRGMVRVEQGLFSKALSDLNSGLSKGKLPADVRVQGRFARARALAGTKQWEPAEELFSALLSQAEAERFRIRLYLERARCRTQLERFADAEADYTAYLALDPRGDVSNGSAFAARGQLRLKLGRPEQAKADLTLLLERWPAHPGATRAKRLLERIAELETKRQP